MSRSSSASLRRPFLRQFVHRETPLPQNPSAVPLPGIDAIRTRLNTGDCNAYIASLLAKANELNGGEGNVAIAKDGLDLLNKISSQGGFVRQDNLKLNRYNVSGTVSGSIAGNNKYAAGTGTVIVSTRWMLGNSAATVSYWQADYLDTMIHEMLHLAGRYSGYDDTELAVAASKLPGEHLPLPPAPTGPNDMDGIGANSGYYDHELKKHCGGK